MTTYEPVIGLEIHAELRTKSKMFCGCSAAYSEHPAPNTLVCPVCTALPGAMPVVNKKAVEQAILVGLALNCTINPMNQFARKNYFYPDLPKGYQISQYDLPVASDGWLDILEQERSPARAGAARPPGRGYRQTIPSGPACPGGLQPGRRSVAGDRLRAGHAHRRGCPGVCHQDPGHPALSGRQLRGYGKRCLRFEANVSVRPIGSQELRTRTEIKNLNSFRALTRASAYEIQRQTQLYESGGGVIQETLGWDDVKEVTVSQRSKEEAHDYRYFPEPDLPPLEISRAWVEQIKTQLPELPEARSQRFVAEFGLTSKEANLLTSEKSLADYFEKTVSLSKSPAKAINNWISGEFLRYVNELGLDLDHLPVPAVASG